MGLGWGEIVVIFVIALVIFGPRKLPELGRSLGKGISEFKRASSDLRRTWEEEVQAEGDAIRNEVNALDSAVRENFQQAPGEKAGRETAGEARPAEAKAAESKAAESKAAESRAVESKAVD